MYTEKNFNDDLFRICQSRYVKFKLLQDFAYKRISQRDFVDQISSRKDRDEINHVLNEVYRLQQKVQQNGGRLDKDPVSAAQGLRRAGKLQEAFDKVVPYIQQNKNDEDANLTFGWIMYDYLKASEKDSTTYANNLKKLNDLVQFDFRRNNNEYVTTLLNSLLWSIRRVAIQGELPANRIFEQFKRFVGNSPSFIEKRMWSVFTNDNDASPSRLLIKELRSKLNESNYFSLIDMIGFDWLDDSDYVTSSFKGKNGETVKMRPLAEKTLNDYAKKLIQSDENFATRERIIAFLPKLTSAINSYSEYEWLPYYKIKLLIKISDNEQAFSEVTEFARNKSRDFWVWDLISDLVDEDEQFNCLCAGLLCKIKPEMIVGLQEKSISYLIEREMLEEAKHILDKLIETRTNKGWNISPELQSMKSSSWYGESKAAPNIDSLQPFADEAQKILYRTLPFTDAFITYINDEKGVINFAFMVGNATKEGYFYKDSTDKNFVWKINSPTKIRMIADKKRDSLFHVFAVENGNVESASKFVKEFSGIFEKVKEFGFIRDSIAEIFVNPTLVKENNLQPLSKVSGSIIKKWDNKKNCWVWQITSIDRVEEPSVSDFEKEISGEIEITMKGFGFIDECFVPEDLIRSRGISEYDFVKAKAQKSWDKSKGHWSWKATEIISMTQEEEFDSWASEIGATIQNKDDAEYLKWIEESLNFNSSRIDEPKVD